MRGMGDPPVAVTWACSKRNGSSMAHDGGAPRSRPNSAVRGSISSGARPRRGSVRYQSLWALRNGGSMARTPRAKAPVAHYNHGEQFSHAQREEGRGNKLRKVPHQRVVLQRQAVIGDRRCNGGSTAAWRLGGAPVSNPHAERGVEGVEGGCRRPPPPRGAPVRRSGRSWPSRWRGGGYRARGSRSGGARFYGLRVGMTGRKEGRRGQLKAGGDPGEACPGKVARERHGGISGGRSASTSRGRRS